MTSLRVCVECRPRILIAGQDAFFTVGLARPVEEPFFHGEIEVEGEIDGVQLQVLLNRSIDGAEEQLGKKLVTYSARFGAEAVMCCTLRDHGQLKLTLRLSRVDEIWMPPRQLGEDVALSPLTVAAGQRTPQQEERIFTQVAERAPVGRADEILDLSITAGKHFTISRKWGGNTYESAIIPLSLTDFASELRDARDRLNEISESYDFSMENRDQDPLRFKDQEGGKRTREIAEIGRDLYKKVLEHGLTVRTTSAQSLLLEQLREMPTDTLIRIENAHGQFALPWNIIFDREIPKGEFTSEHVAGFWGYRYRFAEFFPTELRGELRRGIPLQRKMCAYVDPTLGEKNPRSESLKAAAQIHRRTLEAINARHEGTSIHLVPDSAEAVRAKDFDLFGHLSDAIGGRDPKHLLYFFCHGESSSKFENGRMVAKKARLRLASGSKHELSLEELTRFNKQFGFAFESEPVVFLNCCESASLDPFGVSSLIGAFASMLYASSVIGCAWQVPGWFAHGFAQRFLEEFLRGGGMPLGNVLLEIRRALLNQLNPFGLIYHVYGNTGVRLS